MKILAHGHLLETGLSSVTPWTASTQTFSTLVLSVDTSSEQEVMDDVHNLNSLVNDLSFGVLLQPTPPYP